VLGGGPQQFLTQQLEVEISSNPFAAYMYRLQRHVDVITHVPQYVVHLFTDLQSSNVVASSGKSLIGSRNTVTKLELAASNAVEQGSIQWRRDLGSVVDAQSKVISLSAEAGRATMHMFDGSFVVLDLKKGSLIEYQRSTTTAAKAVGSPGLRMDKIAAYVPH
jgi:hypothetical protein